MKAFLDKLLETIKAPIRNLLEKEPARLIAAVGAAVTAVALWLAQQAGFTIPEDWLPWIVLIVGGAIVEAIRQFVYAPDTTQLIADRAATTGNTDIGNPPEGPAF